jgi:RNA polymerase sigma-70 factor, ECF subfamily
VECDDPKDPGDGGACSAYHEAFSHFKVSRRKQGRDDWATSLVRKDAGGATFGLLVCTTRVAPLVAPLHIDACEDDAVIVGRVLAGETEAFRGLVERYEASVLRIVRNLTPRGMAPEDIAQDAFVSAFLALRSFDAIRGPFAPWLFAIAKNKSLNARKKMAPLLVDELPVVAFATTPADDLAHAETRKRLDAALEALPDDQRSCFVFEEIVGLTTDQVAEMEGVAVGTIRSRLSSAKASLRAALAPFLGEDA